MKTVLNTRTFR